MYAHVRACTRRRERARYTPDAATQRLTLRSHHHTAIGQQIDVVVVMKTPGVIKLPPCTSGPSHSSQGIILIA